MVAVAENSS